MKQMHVLKMMAAVALLGGATAQAQLGEPKMVFVDLDKVFTGYYDTQQSDKQLKELADGFKADRKLLVDDYEKLQDEFKAARDEAQNTALSDDARSMKRSEAEEKLVAVREQESKVRRFDETHQKQLDDQSRRMRKRIVEDITREVETYARSQGYTAVVDASGETLNGVPVVIYHDSRTDITEPVIAILNRGHEAEVSEEPAPRLSAPAR